MFSPLPHCDRVAFGRASREGKDIVLCVANLSPVPRGPYYGGTDTGNLGGIEAEPIPWSQQAFSAEITLPPMGVLWLVPEEKPKP